MRPILAWHMNKHKGGHLLAQVWVVPRQYISLNSTNACIKMSRDNRMSTGRVVALKPYTLLSTMVSLVVHLCTLVPPQCG